MDHIVPDIEQCLNDPTYTPIFQAVPAWHFPGWPSCDWFSADALYSGLPNTTDLSALTFPVNRTYVILGINQPRLKKSIYSNLMLTAVVHFEGMGGREGGRGVYTCLTFFVIVLGVDSYPCASPPTNSLSSSLPPSPPRS